MLRRNRKFNAPSQHLLSRLNGRSMYSDIRQLDSWNPTDFPGALYPVRPDALYAVSQRVDGLAQAGSLDFAHGSVVDGEIDSWHRGWVSRANIDYKDKRHVLARLEGASLEELTLRRREHDVAADALAEAQATLAKARREYFADESAPVADDHNE